MNNKLFYSSIVSASKLQVVLLVAVVLVGMVAVIELGVIIENMRKIFSIAPSEPTTSSSAVATPRPTASDTRDECWDAMALMERWCTTDQWFDECWDMMTQVQSLIRFGNKTAIFAELKKLEPQTGVISVWAADQATEDSDSHLNLDVAGVADYFNNSAYFYTYRMHRLSVECGGWAVSYWKDPAPNVTRAIQLSYCELTQSQIRVCGAFDVITKPEPKK